MSLGSFTFGFALDESALRGNQQRQKVLTFPRIVECCMYHIPSTSSSLCHQEESSRHLLLGLDEVAQYWPLQPHLVQL